MSESLILCAQEIQTGAPDRPRARCLRVEDGRITHLADRPEALPTATRRVERPQAVVVPGLVDAHLHLQPLGAARRMVDLGGCASAQHVSARVAAAAVSTSGWIEGFGWDHNLWSSPAGLDRHTLDRVTGDRPAWLTRVDVHAGWLNSAALAACGIDATTPDPPGGEIVRDASGHPTGVLVDTAMSLAAQRRPPATPAQLQADLEAGLERCREAGLVAVHDHFVTPEVLAALLALEARGAVPLEVKVYLHGDEAALAPLLSIRHRGARVEVVGVKLFADGALGSHGAALQTPYADRPGHRGLLVTPPAELAARAAAAARQGAGVAIHAIGDAGVSAALDALATARAEAGPGPHRVEHAQVVQPRDRDRFSALGVTASVQPAHARDDLGWVGRRLGPERLALAYPWRTLEAAGANLAFGSDAPVTAPDPLGALHAAVDRGRCGVRPEGWRVDEALSPAAALRALTGGAWAAVGHAETGRLVPGAPAHLCVLDGDPEAVAPGRAWRPRVLEAWVDGHPPG